LKKRTKTCFKCGKEKPVAEFNKGKKPGTFHSYCKVCSSAYGKKRYLKNKEKICSVNRIWKKQRRAELRGYILEYLKTHPCVDCGEDDVIVLTFDHVNGEKNFNISDAISHGKPWTEIKKEITKCVVRCANCHLKKTATQQGWWTTQI